MSTSYSLPPTPYSRWRYWLSYLWEQTLEVTSSEYNDYLEVCLVRGRLQLVAEEAIYSFGDYYHNFRRLFEVFDFGCLPERAEVLVLGLGLGSIPELLEKRGLRYDYVAVEIDAVIVALASRYSLPVLRSAVEVVEADAVAFLKQDGRTYDLICVDVFQDARVPDALNEGTFLEMCRMALRPRGCVVFNRLAATPADRAESVNYYRKVFAPAFPAPHKFDTGGNLMLVNDVAFLTLPG